MILWEPFNKEFGILPASLPDDPAQTPFWNPDKQAHTILMALAQRRLWTIYDHETGLEIMRPGMRGVGKALVITEQPYNDVHIVVHTDELAFGVRTCTGCEQGAMLATESKAGTEEDTYDVLFACSCGHTEECVYNGAQLEWVTPPKGELL